MSEQVNKIVFELGTLSVWEATTTTLFTTTAPMYFWKCERLRRSQGHWSTIYETVKHYSNELQLERQKFVTSNKNPVISRTYDHNVIIVDFVNKPKGPKK